MIFNPFLFLFFEKLTICSFTFWQDFQVQAGGAVMRKKWEKQNKKNKKTQSLDWNLHRLDCGRMGMLKSIVDEFDLIQLGKRHKKTGSNHNIWLLVYDKT